MYTSFETKIENGKIKIPRNLHLKKSTKVIVTILENKEEDIDWNIFNTWVENQKKKKKMSSYQNIPQALEHLKKLKKK